MRPIILSRDGLVSDIALMFRESNGIGVARRSLATPSGAAISDRSASGRLSRVILSDTGAIQHRIAAALGVWTANVSGHGPRSPARARTITLVKTLGRRRWKQASGYHRQGRLENTFFRYKSIIGAGLRARSSAGQGSEIVLGCEILNRMTALGRPVSYRIGR